MTKGKKNSCWDTVGEVLQAKVTLLSRSVIVGMDRKIKTNGGVKLAGFADLLCSVL